jgi:hypothetical protein
MGTAANNHLSAYRSFPTGGWGWVWIGDPDRGFGKNQPGAWSYSLWPFMELKDLWMAGKGFDFTKNAAAKKTATWLQMHTSASGFLCPTRPRVGGVFPWSAGSWPNNGGLTGGPSTTNSTFFVNKSDYAANAGNINGSNDQIQGPGSYTEGDTTFKWPLDGQNNGIIYCRSRVTTAMVKDGLSKTMLISEKFLVSDHYMDGNDPSDNESLTTGFDNDNSRVSDSSWPPLADISSKNPHCPSTVGVQFGSAHTNGFHAVFCDASVHQIDYEIDMKVLGNLCNRQDGQGLTGDFIH